MDTWTSTTTRTETLMGREDRTFQEKDAGKLREEAGARRPGELWFNGSRRERLVPFLQQQTDTSGAGPSLGSAPAAPGNDC